MAIPAKDLFDLAREVEERIGRLYADMSKRLPEEGVSAEAKGFFSALADQEQEHASWVQEAGGRVPEDFVFEELAPEEFRITLGTVEDVHDEVVDRSVDVAGSLEICEHLESGVAENFYRRFPDRVPGLDPGFVERMVRSCTDHARAIAEFRKAHFPADAD